MLEIESYRQIGVNVDIASDEYVPLIVTTSPGPLAVCYHTVGDRVTSLVEVKIEQVSRLIRELVLVSFQDLIAFSEPRDVSVSEGLPIVAVSSIPEFREHVDAAVKVGLGADAVRVDWGGGTEIDQVIRQDRIEFLVGRSQLLGVVVKQLSSRDVECLRRHASRS
jgi:hypothetical protein